MLAGTVKNWTPGRGFGFIERDDGQGAVFVHARAVRHLGRDFLNEGERVVFDLQRDLARGKYHAVDVRLA